jgi:hypothetical protein
LAGHDIVERFSRYHTLQSPHPGKSPLDPIAIPRDLLPQNETSGFEITSVGRHAGCIRHTGYFLEAGVHDALVALFAIAAGFTASGIAASLYRLVAKDTGSPLGRAIYVAVMIFAGPTVLFENAARAWRQKSCSGVAFWLAAALSGYWSMALGLLVIQFGLALRGL